MVSHDDMKTRSITSSPLGKGGFLPDTFFDEVDQFLEGTESEEESAEDDYPGLCSIPISSPPPPTPILALGSPSTQQSTQMAATARPVKSVLKKTSSYNGLMEIGDEEIIPIRTEKSAWKTLPAPCVQPVRRVISSPDLEGNEENFSNMKRNVSFNQILIRDYEMTVGDGVPVDGVPVGLDWKYRELEPLPIDAYEKYRLSRRRNRQQMRLGPIDRNDIVRGAGLSRGEIKEAKKQVAKTQRQRAATLSKLSWMPMEAMVESATRKMKRGLAKTLGRSKSSDALVHL